MHPGMLGRSCSTTTDTIVRTTMPPAIVYGSIPPGRSPRPAAPLRRCFSDAQQTSVPVKHTFVHYDHPSDLFASSIQKPTKRCSSAPPAPLDFSTSDLLR